MKKRLRGKLSDFWTIPVALFLAYLWENASILMGWFSLTPEKIGKIVPATVVALLVLGISRLVNWAQYPDIYHYGLMKNSNPVWDKLEDSEKFKYAWQQRLFLAALWGIIVWAM